MIRRGRFWLFGRIDLARRHACGSFLIALI
jgi:hypothetical protein